jgi:amino acid transporter
MNGKNLPPDFSTNNLRATAEAKKPMSVSDAFIYNFLAMGVIFPWIYVWGPASFPGGSLELGIWLTFAAQLPISLAYCFLATVMPFSGGDYIFQTRAFGKWGFVSVMSGFVFWILQWIALSGWLFAKLGLTPLLLCVGVYRDNSIVTQTAIMLQSSWGVFIVSILLTAVAVLFLVGGGLRLYVRVQKVLFALTIISIATILIVFMWGSFESNLNEFTSKLIGQIDDSSLHSLKDNFVQFLITDVKNSGMNVSQQFGLIATLGIVPIAWTSLYSAGWSVQQNDEIERADRFWVQFRIIVLSSLLVAFCLWALAYFERRATSHEFMTAASAVYWQRRGSPETVWLVKNVLPPFPNVLAMASSKSLLVSLIIALGFLANAFQVTCNCFIGVTRVLVAMSNDNVLPTWLNLERQETQPRKFKRAHWIYFLAAIPWIICFNFVPGWENYSLGVTFALGYVFTLSVLASTRLTSGKLKALWGRSSISHFNKRLVRLIGYVGFVLGSTMVIAYYWFPQLGLTGDAPYLIVLGIILISYVIYAAAESKSDSRQHSQKPSPDASQEEVQTLKPDTE